MEDLFGRQYESEMGHILKSLSQSNKTITLTRIQERLIKKYLVLQWIRTTSELKVYEGAKWEWLNLLNHFIPKIALSKLSSNPDPQISQIAELFDKGYLLFVKTDDEFIMPDGGMMTDYVQYTSSIIANLRVDEDALPNIKYGFIPGCPKGRVMNYMFYPLGAKMGVVLLNPLWTDKDYIIDVGRIMALIPEVTAINVWELLDSSLWDEKATTFEKGSTYNIKKLDTWQTNLLVKETLGAVEDLFVFQSFNNVIGPLLEFVEDKPNHPLNKELRELSKDIMKKLKS